MKKVLLSLFLVLSLIICCGCSDDKPPVIDNDENFGEQRFLYAATWGGRLIRYDVVDKKATVACPDPQCNHDDNCLVTKIDRLTVSDDYLLYVRGEFAGDIYCYDIKAGKIDKIHSAAQSSALYLINDTVFFSASQYEYNEDGSLKSEVWNVYKYDIVSKNLAKINDTPIAASVSESLADLFQVLYNFVETIKNAPESMYSVALVAVKDDFGSYWSRILCNVMRPLNQLHHNATDENEY